MVIKSTEMSNTIPDQKVTATFLTYLAARLLDLSIEMQAARTIQFAWKKYINNKREAALKVKYSNLWSIFIYFTFWLEINSNKRHVP